jgi:7-cyano-7-deazaguanine synthase in queuosine biosynthesis
MTAQYLVQRGGSAQARGAFILEVGGNLRTGEQDFIGEFGQPTTLEVDLLSLAAAVFAADRATARGPREDYCRNIEVSLPVVNVMRLLPLVPPIERVLRLLSNDGWTITLRQLEGSAEDTFPLQGRAGKTLLFSGGVDSLAAAIELGREAQPLELVSHHTHNAATDNAQRTLATRLLGAGYSIRHRRFFVSSLDGGPTALQHAVESSQRTRSFVFLILGALVARRTGHYEMLYLAENGQMAIHLPLTAARIGAFSTHTAHPAVLAQMQQILATALAAPVRIENPFLYRTKREVTQIVVGALPDALAETTSCWRNARLPAGSTHCGDCVPCQVRRLAIEAIQPDNTRYARDLWAEPVVALPPEDDGRRNIVDLAEFATRFARADNEELMSEYPELYSHAFDGNAAIAMYKRFAIEAVGVLRRYPNLAPLLA